MRDLHRLGVRDALAAYRSRDLSPVDHLEALLARIEELNPSINAIVELLADDARQAAEEAASRYADFERTNSDLSAASAAQAGLPPLLGLPLLAKEQHDIAGRSATRGSRTLAGAVAESDHPIIVRLREAGAVIFGRTTTPEFSCATFTQTTEWGITRNPFNPEKSPGGSSGGSAAAVAAGFAPGATASDIGGSTRVPAAFCGIVGFKTPYGRTPGLAPLNLDHYRGDHMLARSIGDSALLTNAIVGPHPLDHSTVAPKHVLPTEFDGAAGLKGMRIAVSATLGCFDVDPDVLAAFERVCETLDDAGAELVEAGIELTFEDIDGAAMTHYGHLLAGNLRRLTGGDLSLLDDYTRRFVELSGQFAAERPLIESFAAENRVQQAIAAGMAGADALITPTSAAATLQAGEQFLEGNLRRSGVTEHYWHGHLTIPFNIANRLPVLAVPSGMGDAGVPTGVQIVGHPYDDDTVFRVGAGVEELLPFPVLDR